MATILNQPFQINGVISTDKSVLQNINTLCDAAGCWMTYDITDGKWSVIINKAETTAVATFDDSNIIGGINISSTGVNELYNKVRIEFPHKDLRDQTDFIELSMPSADLFPNEVENTLNMRIDCINNPVQAQYLASVELRQSRVDKVIQFRTDYSYIGVKAGDIISVTNSVYGYTNKFFRVTRIEENDDDVLSISITALEYSASVYSGASSLVREERERSTGIIAKAVNTATTTSDNKAVTAANTSGTADTFTPAAISTAVSAATGPIYEYLTTITNVVTEGFKENFPGTSIPGIYQIAYVWNGASVLSTFNAFAGNVEATPGEQGSGFSGDTSTSVLAFNIGQTDGFDSLTFEVECPFANFFIFPVRPIYQSTATAVATISNFQSFAFSPPLGSPNPQFMVNPTDASIYLDGLIANVGQVYEPIQINAYIPVVITVFDENDNVVGQKLTGLDTGNASITVYNTTSTDYTVTIRPVAARDAYTTSFYYHGGYNNATLSGFVAGETRLKITSYIAS